MIIKLTKKLSKKQITEIHILNKEIFKKNFAWFVITNLSIISINCSKKEIKKIKKVIAY